jgi:hypothetical protein
MLCAAIAGFAQLGSLATRNASTLDRLGDVASAARRTNRDPLFKSPGAK